MRRFNAVPTSIPGMLVIHPRPIADDRGWFMRTFAAEEFRGYGVPCDELVEENHSRSHRHVLRGLHFRTDLREGKLVRVARGAVYDVVVDLRPASPAFLTWCATILDDRDHRQVWVPPGCAHGFQALAESDVCYRVSAAYAPALDALVAWNDAELGVDWPAPRQARLSARDAGAPALAEVRDRLTAWFGGTNVH
jgi:dTDP-4-dehydrorhamnose 3,5-epimerase